MQEVADEIRRRIRWSVASVAYECYDDSIMSDCEYDKLARDIDVKIRTGNDRIDDWFKERFSPDTGSVIHSHPELDALKFIYDKYYKE